MKTEPMMFKKCRLVARCTLVNTKNRYREEIDVWAKFGRRALFGRRFS
jgi:hypothetical protein